MGSGGCVGKWFCASQVQPKGKGRRLSGKRQETEVTDHGCMSTQLGREGHIYRKKFCTWTQREQRTPGVRIPGRLKDRCIRKYQSVSEDRSLWPERGLSEFSV